MTVSAKEAALAAKAKRDEETRRQTAIDLATDKALASKHRILLAAVAEVLKEVAELPGVRVDGRIIHVGHEQYTLTVDLDSGMIRYSDESPEVPYQGYTVHWRSRDGHSYGGISNPDDFRREFGEFIGRRL
jgi:hypothetical protein